MAQYPPIDAEWLEKVRNERYGTIQTDKAAWIGRKRRPVVGDEWRPSGDEEQPGQLFEASKDPSWWIEKAGETAQETMKLGVEATMVPSIRRYLEAVESGSPVAPMIAGAEAALNLPTPVEAPMKLAAKALGNLDTSALMGVIGIPAKGVVKKLREVMAVENRARGVAAPGDTAGRILRGTFFRGQKGYPKVYEQEGRVITEQSAPYSHYREGLPDFRNVKIASGNFGEPRGVSLTYHPKVANMFSGSGQPGVARVFPRYGGRPEEKVLQAYTPKGEEALQKAYVHATEEVLKKHSGLRDTIAERMIAPNSDLTPEDHFIALMRDSSNWSSKVYNEFNEILTKNLQDQGYKGILHSPHRYGEAELRMFDPADVLHLDVREASTMHPIQQLSNRGPGIFEKAENATKRSPYERVAERVDDKLSTHQQETESGPQHLYNTYEKIDLSEVLKPYLEAGDVSSVAKLGKVPLKPSAYIREKEVKKMSDILFGEIDNIQETPEDIVEGFDNAIDPLFHGQETFIKWNSLSQEEKLQAAKGALDKNYTMNLLALQEGSPEDKKELFMNTVKAFKKLGPGPAKSAAPKKSYEMGEPSYFSAEEELEEYMNALSKEQKWSKEGADSIQGAFKPLPKKEGVAKPLTNKEWMINKYGQDTWNKMQKVIKGIKQ